MGAALVGVAWFNARSSRFDVPLILPAFVGLNITFLTDGTWIRGYGPGSVLLILAFGLTAMFIARPTFVRLVAMFLSYIACMQCLYFTAALVPALLLAAFAVCIFRRQMKWALALCVVAAVCAISYLPQFQTYREIKAWTILLRYPTSPQLIWHEFQVACGQPVPLMAGVWLTVALISILGGVALLSRRTWRTDTGPVLLGLLTILIAATTYFAFLAITHTAPQTRYHLAFLCLLAAVAELIIATLCRFQSVRIARLILVVSLGVALPFTLWPRITQRETTVDLLARNLQQYAGAEDLIIVNPWFPG